MVARISMRSRRLHLRRPRPQGEPNGSRGTEGLPRERALGLSRGGTGVAPGGPMRLLAASLFSTALFASSLANAETVVEYSDEPMGRTGWNMIAGGVGGGSGDTLQGEVGY